MFEGEPKFEPNNVDEGRPAPISRVVGLSEKRETQTVKDFEEIFKGQHIEGERPKTREEEKFAEGILEKIPDFIKGYGGQPVEPLTLNCVHFVERGDENQEKYKRGGYNPVAQVLYVIDDGNILRNARTLCHELFHLNSFQSIWFRTYQEGEAFQLRRTGFQIHGKNDGETIYFDEINEAITEELSIRFSDKYFPEIDPLAKAKIKIQDDVKNMSDFGRSMIEAVANTRGYGAERDVLKRIIDDIYSNSQDKFKSTEEVFNEFAKAYFTGELLTIAHLIEKTYGEGSFRKLGEETKKK